MILQDLLLITLEMVTLVEAMLIAAAKVEELATSLEIQATVAMVV
jgi:hypothetical protein